MRELGERWGEIIATLVTLRIAHVFVKCITQQMNAKQDEKNVEL